MDSNGLNGWNGFIGDFKSKGYVTRASIYQSYPYIAWISRYKYPKSPAISNFTWKSPIENKIRVFLEFIPQRLHPGLISFYGDVIFGGLLKADSLSGKVLKSEVSRHVFFSHV